MQPFVIPVTCSVCGAEGMAHASDAKYTWTANFRHSDPEVCAGVLRQKSDELRQHEDDFKRKVEIELKKN